ncbi:hypothetical protein EXIGLDRAFT_205846 [Exidia glandulosa HHB12029]|uniref:Uncharacterized protein n=1 Tax=Exidia glandulosa HHB12029 TaxID=1314781 RepID=A0A165MVU5_EXIGL|nr:hypothetical protein EXIGLDRAFT_205846 [Exidia glandulosa HHB12029]
MLYFIYESMSCRETPWTRRRGAQSTLPHCRTIVLIVLSTHLLLMIPELHLIKASNRRFTRRTFHGLHHTRSSTFLSSTHHSNHIAWHGHPVCP